MIPSELLVNFYQTSQPYNPEDTHVHARLQEDLKFHIFFVLPISPFPKRFTHHNQFRCFRNFCLEYVLFNGHSQSLNLRPLKLQ